METETPEPKIVDIKTYIISKEEAADLISSAAGVATSLAMVGIEPAALMSVLPGILTLSTEKAESAIEVIEKVESFIRNNAATLAAVYSEMKAALLDGAAEDPNDESDL